MELLLRIAGILLVGLAIAHTVFPRYFGWREELAKVGLLTRQIFFVHTFFIALTVGLMGLLCIASPGELVTSPLGRKISAGFAAFWICRFIVQLFGYSPALWRGKALETAAHVLFSLFWLFLSLLFTFAALGVTVA